MKKLLLSCLCLLAMALPSLAAEKNFKWSYDKNTSKATITGSMTKEGTIKTGDVTWNFIANANTLVQNYGTDPKGIQLGGKNNKTIYSPTDLTLSTAFFKDKTIKKVSFSIYTDDGKGTVTVSCGTEVLSSISITGTKTNAQTFTWEGVSVCSDLLSINIKQTNQKYAYINNFDITYDDEVVTPPTPPTYPTECADPVFTLSTIGELNSGATELKATGYAGTKVSVACATKDSEITWSVAKNAEKAIDIEGVEYVVPADAVVGDVYKFEALASVQGEKEPLLSNIVTLELTIAEAPLEGFFYTAAVDPVPVFGTKLENKDGVEGGQNNTVDKALCSREGGFDSLAANITFSSTDGSNFAYINKDKTITIYKGNTFVISVKKGYSITKIEFNASNDELSAEAGKGTFEKGIFVASGENVANVKFTYDSKASSNWNTNCISAIKVSYSKAPVAPEMPDFEGEHEGKEVISATGNVDLNFAKVDGVTVYYRLNMKENAQDVAPMAENTVDHADHNGFTAHDGSAITAGINHASIDFFACDNKTGLHSPMKTVTFDITTGIEDIEAAENAEAIYFNLQGVRVANPENGLYIRVINGKAEKVIVK